MELQINNLTHRYGELEVLKNINLRFARHEIVCIIGPSGCGKSTLLRLLGGLEQASEGEVLQVGESSSDSLNPLTYIFQDFALLPWRTVAGNLSLVLEDHSLGKADIAARIAEVLKRTDLSKFADAFPKQLSGGMKQRVAIARALIVNPECLLMDEPLSALDSQTRELLMDDLIGLWERERFTACYVTHNLNEAVRLGHRVVVLSRRPGEIREIVDIDIPISERNDAVKEMHDLQQNLWQMMRDEAATADRELAND